MDKEYLQKYYGLKNNPFIEDSAIKNHIRMWVDREEQMEKWKEIVLQAKGVRKNYISFIIGSYGRGKTISLFKIFQIAEENEDILPIYLNFKSEERPKAAIDFMFRIFELSAESVLLIPISVQDSKGMT